jgi:hypothetical protein
MCRANTPRRGGVFGLNDLNIESEEDFKGRTATTGTGRDIGSETKMGDAESAGGEGLRFRVYGLGFRV